VAREPEDRLRDDDVLTLRWCQWLAAGIGTQSPRVHVFGDRQSAAVWQGKAHLPYCRLQWCVPHGTSSLHWKAIGPGTAICPEPAGGGVVPGIPVGGVVAGGG
jgi:hypothetical protein